MDDDAIALVANIRHASRAIKLTVECSLLREFDLARAGCSALFILFQRER
jgi:hypothetical protein